MLVRNVIFGRESVLLVQGKPVGGKRSFSRVTRFRRNITEREHLVIQSVMLVQGEPIRELRSSHEKCVLV